MLESIRTGVHWHWLLQKDLPARTRPTQQQASSESHEASCDRNPQHPERRPKLFFSAQCVLPLNFPPIIASRRDLTALSFYNELVMERFLCWCVLCAQLIIFYKIRESCCITIPVPLPDRYSQTSKTWCNTIWPFAGVWSLCVYFRPNNAASQRGSSFWAATGCTMAATVSVRCVFLLLQVHTHAHTHTHIHKNTCIHSQTHIHIHTCHRPPAARTISIQIWDRSSRANSCTRACTRGMVALSPATRMRCVRVDVYSREISVSLYQFLGGVQILHWAVSRN